MATLLLVRNKRKAKQDGTYPLSYRIGMGRKYPFIRIGIYILDGQIDCFSTFKQKD